MNAQPDHIPASGHRERLLAGMAASIHEKGYRGTKISDIVRHARTSRRTFYEYFADKESCLLELFDLTTGVLLEHVANAVDRSAPWDAQIDQAVDAYIDTLASEPELSVSYARELPALGAAAVARQRAAIERFAEMCVRLANTEELRRAGMRPVSMQTALMLVGGLRELAIHTVEHGGDVRELRDVAKDVWKAVGSAHRVAPAAALDQAARRSTKRSRRSIRS
jgi:AcrR family transcriptional regulator